MPANCYYQFVTFFLNPTVKHILAGKTHNMKTSTCLNGRQKGESWKATGTY
jgi:hypothetical protein